LHSVRFSSLLAAIGFVSSAACSSASDDDEPPRMICPIGDLDAQTEIEIVHRNGEGAMTVTSSGAEVPVQYAIQGGFVLYASIRAKNIDGCSTVISAELRDACDRLLIAGDRRSVSLVPAGDGWGEPQNPTDPGFYANIPACPRVVAERDIEGEPHILEVTAIDADGRRASASVPITPICLDNEYLEGCICECDGGYTVMNGCEPEMPSPGCDR
jgi:hypothetical protein